MHTFMYISKQEEVYFLFIFKLEMQRADVVDFQRKLYIDDKRKKDFQYN